MAEYIEREAVLALTREIHIPEVGYRHRCIDPQNIRELHAADVAPVRHGRWREVEHGESGHLCECSVCKEWLLFYYGFVANYCPVCGAKMDLKDGDGE